MGPEGAVVVDCLLPEASLVNQVEKTRTRWPIVFFSVSQFALQVFDTRTQKPKPLSNIENHRKPCLLILRFCSVSSGSSAAIDLCWRSCYTLLTAAGLKGRSPAAPRFTEWFSLASTGQVVDSNPDPGTSLLKVAPVEAWVQFLDSA